MSKIHTLAISLLLILFVFILIASFNYSAPFKHRTFGEALMFPGSYSITAAIFATLIAWLTARRRKQMQTVH